jgi:hypothetical protein
MADTDCQTACAGAYTAQVDRCADVLRDNLVLAKTDEDKQLAQTEFERCMALAKETKTICLKTCAEED